MEEGGRRKRRSSRRQPVKTIAVMGPTGSGKSTFINVASGSHLAVGDGLRSCTSAIGHSQAFSINDTLVGLVDTPGFDDSEKSEIEILTIIAAYLAMSLEQGLLLSGIIYMHRISDPRVAGSAMKNLQMFRELCGEKALRNVVFVTNMWGGVDPQTGDQREQDLSENFLKHMLDQGATMMRHDGSMQSAHNIILEVLRHRPRLLRIQRELVREHQELTETTACYELDNQLREERDRFEQDLLGIKGDIDRALQDNDEGVQMELEQHKQRVEVKLQAMRSERDHLKRNYSLEVKRAKQAGLSFLEQSRRLQDNAQQLAERSNLPSEPAHVDNEDPPLPVPHRPRGGSRRHKERPPSHDRPEGHQQQGSGHDSTTAESTTRGIPTRSASVTYSTQGTHRSTHRRAASVNPSVTSRGPTDPRVMDFVGKAFPQPVHEHESAHMSSIHSHEPQQMAPNTPPTDGVPPRVPEKQFSMTSRKSGYSMPGADGDIIRRSMSPVTSKILKDQIRSITQELNETRQLLDTSHHRVADLEQAVDKLARGLIPEDGSLHVLLQEALMELMLAMMGVNAGDRLPQPLRHRYWLRIPSEGMNQLLRPNWIEPWVIKKKWYKPWVKKLTWPKSVIAKFRLEVADLARNNTTLALFRTLTDNDVFVDLEVVYRALQERWEAESKEPSNDGGYYSSELPPPTPLLHPNGHTSMSPAATHHYDSASEEAH